MNLVRLPAGNELIDFDQGAPDGRLHLATLGPRLQREEVWTYYDNSFVSRLG
jgi:hypothetical protein